MSDEDLFGVCPVCHTVEDSIQIGQVVWFYCHTHENKWSWHQVDSEGRKLADVDKHIVDQHENNKTADYKEIEAVYFD